MYDQELHEVRCKGCGRLLGLFAGKGKVKCSKTECGGMNLFDIEKEQHDFKPKIKNQRRRRDKATSGGVMFG